MVLMPRIEYDFTNLEAELVKLAEVVADHDIEFPGHGIDCACMDSISMGFRIAMRRAFRPADRTKTSERGKLIAHRTSTNWDY